MTVVAMNHTPADTHDFFTRSVAETDPELAACLSEELQRQQDGIELIASENITSLAVLQTQGSVLTNKYAEGYPGKRYYGGCDVVDKAETLAIERAKELFDCTFANVQPSSGEMRVHTLGRQHESIVRRVALESNQGIESKIFNLGAHFHRARSRRKRGPVDSDIGDDGSGTRRERNIHSGRRGNKVEHDGLTFKVVDSGIF